MRAISIHKTKRLPLTFCILLIAIALAGMAAAKLHKPPITAEFMHQHIRKKAAMSNFEWLDSRKMAETHESADYLLPRAVRQEIADILDKSDRPNGFGDGFEEAKTRLTGQALALYESRHCRQDQALCTLPIRLDRKLWLSQANRDSRVVNVKERSLNITLKLEDGEHGGRIDTMKEEMRLHRFYQTQSGWIQNTAETLHSEPFAIEPRAHKVAQKFKRPHIGINYYPATASWRDFWVEFPVKTIKADLKIMQDLKVNALRIFLNHDYFEDPQTRYSALLKLKTLLSLCEDYDIQVLVTLFDLRPSYEIAHWHADMQHLDRVMQILQGHKTVLGIDLKNQADLDFPVWSKNMVQSWLIVMARYLQSRYDDIAVTVGWSDASQALELDDVVDFISYHEYRPVEGFKERLDDIKARAGSKPVMITELGSTVWHPPFIKSVSEKQQAKRLAAQLSQSLPSAGIFVWTLHDFDEVGRDVVGPLPWRQAQQRHFGLLRANGSKRPSAEIFKAYGKARLEAIPPDESDAATDVTPPTHLTPDSVNPEPVNPETIKAAPIKAALPE